MAMTATIANGSPENRPQTDILLEVTDLKKYYPITRGIIPRIVGHVRAVDGVSFSLAKGETLGLVGESGCGKTTTGRALLRLVEATSGKVLFEGKDILRLKARELRGLRREMQLIFQDPVGSLDPRMKVRDIIGEGLDLQGIARGIERERRIREIIEVVGLNPGHLNRYPHEFSGGQRQRIGIARALVLRPKLVVCDEPVSALDVSIQAQVLNLLQDLKRQYDLTYLFISHNLGVVKYIADRVAIMYLGKIVEIGRRETIFQTPAHPYTRALLASVPLPEPGRRRERIILEGDMPSPANPPTGCRFSNRCRVANAQCTEEEPLLRELSPGHQVACHRA